MIWKRGFWILVVVHVNSECVMKVFCGLQVQSRFWKMIVGLCIGGFVRNVEDG